MDLVLGLMRLDWACLGRTVAVTQCANRPCCVIVSRILSVKAWVVSVAFWPFKMIVVLFV